MQQVKKSNITSVNTYAQSTKQGSNETKRNNTMGFLSFRHVKITNRESMCDYFLTTLYYRTDRVTINYLVLHFTNNYPIIHIKYNHHPALPTKVNKWY